MKKGQLLITSNDVLKLYKSNAKAKKQLYRYKSWFPLIGSKKLSGVVADLMCDGHLQGDPWWRFDYTFKLFEEKNRFENEIFSLFGIKGRARPCTTNKFSKTFNYGVNCRPLARLLCLCGVPSGNKVLTKYSIPHWILNDKENFRRFVQRFFTCEGTAWGGTSPGIRIEVWKKISIMDNCKDMLDTISIYLDKFFKIKTTRTFTTKSQNKRKDGNITKPLRIHIKRKDSIITFHNEIGFEDKAKQKKLINIIKTWDGKGR